MHSKGSNQQNFQKKKSAKQEGKHLNNISYKGCYDLSPYIPLPNQFYIETYASGW